MEDMDEQQGHPRRESETLRGLVITLIDARRRMMTHAFSRDVQAHSLRSLYLL